MYTSWIIFGAVMIISLIVSQTLKAKFKAFSLIPTNYGLTGRDVAEKMLKDAGIYDVKVTSTPGQLTDHYNPQTKTVNLSEEVYNRASIAAAAVAAHECGHAVQHARAYVPLKLRSALVPAVSFASQWMSWVLLAGILLAGIVSRLLMHQSFPPKPVMRAANWCRPWRGSWHQRRW